MPKHIEKHTSEQIYLYRSTTEDTPQFIFRQTVVHFSTFFAK